MDNFNDMFTQQTQAEIDKYTRQTEQMKKDIQQAGDLARACLNSEGFKHYRDGVKRAQSSLLESMINYTRMFFSQPGGDMAKYGGHMARYMTKIEDLQLLLENVERDARKGTEDAEI